MKKTAFKRHLRMLSILALLWVCSIAHGQIYKYIGLSDGLSSRNVYDVEQSNGGFMWFLTDNGIDRYDGTETTNYKLEVRGHRLTEYSTSQFVYDETDDNLWVVTNLGRIAQYDTRLNTFEVMYIPQIYLEQSNVLRSAVSPIDRLGNMWIFIANEAFCYNVRTKKGQMIKLEAPHDIPTYSAIVARDDSTLFLGTKGGVYIGRVRGNVISTEPVQALQDYKINANTLYYHENTKTLLIGSEDKGIYAYKEHNQSVIHDPKALPDVRVTRIIPTKKNDEILFSTNAACVHQMNIHECIPRPYLSADFTSNYRMNTDNVADICIDKDGQLWMCSFPQGLTVYNDTYPEFNWVKRSLIKSNTLNNNSVECIIEDSEHDLWYATDNGISLYQAKTQQWYTMLSIADKSTNKNHYFLTLCEAKPGVILAGGYAAGIYVIDKNSKKAYFVKPNLMYPEKYIQTMFLDKYDNTIWMGGDNQLINISYINGNIRVNHAEVFRGINYITEKNDHALWIGTKEGLYIFDKLTHTKRRVELPLTNFKVNTIHQDPDGTLYVGTHHHGLIVYNEKNNYYHRYSERNSALTNNCLKCIVNANNGSLFISSDAGIVRYDKRTQRITTWTNDQGLQNINFSIRAGTRTHNKTIMFGGDNGVIEINSDHHLPHIYKGTLVLSDLYIGNTRITPENEKSPINDAINNVSEIKLKDRQHNAAIKVKCINHIYPSDCIVKWTTDNPNRKNAKWHLLNEDKFIVFNNFKVGRHNLTIQAVSNESGDILDKRTLSVTILPPFYFSLWGILLELTFLVIVVCLIIQYYKSSNAIHISNEKVLFFTNTAHDIRTPLTLIKAPLEELSNSTTLNSTEREAVDLALKNTNTLAEMTENVMRYEIESIERGILRIERHEAIAHISKQIDRWRLLAQTKQQQIIYIHPEQPFHIWIDARKLNSIIQNLLSNAIKYSNKGETITFNLYNNERTWGFHVIDNGIGIANEEQKKLFRQLFRGINAINSKILGSGLGLLSIGRYIHDMSGKVEVNSQLNKGADFHIRFPMGKEHYDKNNTLFITPHQDEENAPLILQANDSEDTQPTDTRTRMLIVEDNPELLAYLTRIFSKEYQTYTATNGKEALSKLPYVHPTIVLTDVMMPEMRGDELCVSIKSNINTSHIAVVLISALADQQSIIKGLTMKADAYVTKPFDMKVLQLTIQNIVESRRQLWERLASTEETISVSEGTTELDLKLMTEMKQIIETHISAPDFTIEVLAYEMRISRTTLYNKVKGLTGNTPSDLIREYRIAKAKKLLGEQHLSVAEVADHVGFSDQKYFREVFKKATGMTPSEYARTRRENQSKHVL